MPDKSYTILILARGSSRFRKVRISQRVVWAAGIAGALVVAAALLVPKLAWTAHEHRAAFETLEQENRALMNEKLEWERAMASLSDKLDEFESKTWRLAQELGVEPPEAPAGGAATDGQVRTIADQELQSLGARADILDDSLSRLDNVYTERLRLLASTPNRMPVEGWFSHGYGWRKDPWTGEREFHRGIDIVADAGTPILAPADGVVSRTARVSDYGKTVDVSHGSGYVTRYAHMSELLVKTGQRVRRGDVIGKVGSTGRSTGPHLHYEVFRDGRRVNPWKYLGQRGS